MASMPGGLCRNVSCSTDRRALFRNERRLLFWPVRVFRRGEFGMCLMTVCGQVCCWCIECRLLHRGRQLQGFGYADIHC
jgi:hypothetical protein